MTLYCVCRGSTGLLFLKSGDDLADVQRRATEAATILTCGTCPARAVQHFFELNGEVRGVDEKPVDDLVKKLVSQAVGWSECPPNCQHSDIRNV